MTDLQDKAALIDEWMLFKDFEQVAGEVQHVVAVVVHHERGTGQLIVRRHSSYTDRFHFRHHLVQAAAANSSPQSTRRRATYYSSARNLATCKLQPVTCYLFS